MSKEEELRAELVEAQERIVALKEEKLILLNGLKDVYSFAAMYNGTTINHVKNQVRGLLERVGVRPK